MRRALAPASLAALAALMVAGGCAHRLPPTTQTHFEIDGWQGQALAYRCADGQTLRVAYLNPRHGSALAVLAQGDTLAVLRNVPTASGARYADTDEQRGLRWHTKGREGRLALMPPDHTATERTLAADCQARP